MGRGPRRVALPRSQPESWWAHPPLAPGAGVAIAVHVGSAVGSVAMWQPARDWLQAALQAKERELTALRASKAAASAGGAADAVKELTRQRDDAVQAQELLQQQLIHARNDLSTAEANFRAQQAAMAAATESEQAKALQQQMWALTEQHSKKVEELEAELKQKQVMIQQLQATKSDALQAMKVGMEMEMGSCGAWRRAGLGTAGWGGAGAGYSRTAGLVKLGC